MNPGKAMVCAVLILALLLAAQAMGQGKTKTENFDRDPGWEGVNNRIARNAKPVTIKQDFGYTNTNQAGGQRAGEIGGFISAAAEPAYYANALDSNKTFNDKLIASGTFAVADGGTHLLLGFFNSATANEWRTPNTIAIRILGRGDHFFAFVEYCTSKWRAGGDKPPKSFPMTKDDAGRDLLIGFPSRGKSHQWSLTYDPNGNGGKGVVTATIDGATAVGYLEDGHKADGATFNRFGILNVMKSADLGSEIYLDDMTINGELETCDADPRWQGRNNRRTYQTSVVRPYFDFGYTTRSLPGARARESSAGSCFAAICRYAERLAFYGDRVGPLTHDRPFVASGKVALRCGVTDTTTLFGFFSAERSMRVTASQKHSLPENFTGAYIAGPSSEGFLLHPAYRMAGGDDTAPSQYSSPHIYPDGVSHDWALRYDPNGADGKGRLTVSLDGREVSLDLKAGEKSSGTRLDRFGIVTTWHDGNAQQVYFDDITYTVSQ